MTDSIDNRIVMVMIIVRIRKDLAAWSQISVLIVEHICTKFHRSTLSRNRVVSLPRTMRSKNSLERGVTGKYAGA